MEARQLEWKQGVECEQVCWNGKLLEPYWNILFMC